MKLITANEWVTDLRKRKRPPGTVNLVGWVTETEIAEVQRNAGQYALERAASRLRHKADCADKLDLSSEAALLRVAAKYVLDLIPENPAPADEVKP